MKKRARQGLIDMMNGGFDESVDSDSLEPEYDPEPMLLQNVHLSVGAIITNGDGMILMIDRNKTPFGWACPAGHVDDGELPIDAVAREVEEETGLTVTEITDMRCTIQDSLEMPQDLCSRGIGTHLWSIYSVKTEGTLVMKEDEVKAIMWVTPEYLPTTNLEPAWRYWLEKFGIIKK